MGPFIVIAIVVIIVVVVRFFVNSSNDSPRDGSSFSNPSTNSYRSSSYTPNVKEIGEEGERIVKKVLGHDIADEKYVINNLMIVNEGKSSQIDHLVVCLNGIFVIETKNYSGLILGNENQKEWTQVLGGGSERHKFYNPVLQNRSHIYAISRIIKRGIFSLPLLSFQILS